MKKVIIYLILFNSLFSCNVKNKIYLDPKVNPNQKDKYSEYCNICLFVILDNSLAENEVLISDSQNTNYSIFSKDENSSYSNKDTIYYNKLVPKKIKNDFEEIIKVRNYKAVDIFVNKDSILIRDFTFSLYRFVVVTKKNKFKKPTFIFTNDISNYPKVLERLNGKIPEIILPDQSNIIPKR
ncbi:hypothetical protein [Flavobacterium sp.]